MYCQSITSYLRNEREAIEDIHSKLHDKRPAMVVCYYTEDYCAAKLFGAMQSLFPHTPFHGASSCRAVMTDTGFHLGPVVAVFVIYDESNTNAYGTGIGNYDHPHLCLKERVFDTLLSAAQQADRVGEIPSLILLHTTPGDEEPVIAAIDEHFGTLVPVIGGSAADNNIENRWSIFTNQGHCRNGLSMTLFYSSTSIYTSFSSGHVTTPLSGIATQVNGRKLEKIDNCPALEIYEKWTGLNFDEYDEERSLFKLSNAYPLGRKAGQVYDKAYYKLSHPIRETCNGGIELFNEIQQGERVHLMHGGRKQLLERSANVISAAFAQKLEEVKKIGVINIFCAGSMIYLKEDMDKVYMSIKRELEHKPFICPFTFGEQGRFVGGEYGHGNLMISSAIFHKPIG